MFELVERLDLLHLAVDLDELRDCARATWVMPSVTNASDSADILWL